MTTFNRDRTRGYAHRTDDELLLALKSDDSQAFRALYDRYWKKLYVIAANRVDNEMDAEEIVQDIFTALWSRRNEVAVSEDGLGKYLAASVKYRVIKTLGKYAVRQKYMDAIPMEHCIDDSTQQWLAFEELKDELAKYVKQLPDKCQLVFHLSRQMGYSQKQIAADLSISEKTVEAHLQKAFKVLRTKLAAFTITLL